MRRLTLPTLVLACLCLCAALAAGAQDAEVVKEFRKYFKKYKDTPTRVEAVLALESNESPLVVEALVEVVDGAEADVQRAAVRVLSKFQTRPPVDALLAELESNKREGVRLALLEAVAVGGYTGAGPIVATLLADKSWNVRRQALTALARTAAAPAAETLAPAPAEPPVPPLDVPAALVPAPPTGEPAVPPVATGSASSVTQPTVPKLKREAQSPAPIGKKDRLDFMVVLLPARRPTFIGAALQAGKYE